MKTSPIKLAVLTGALLVGSGAMAQDMNFFVTSSGSGHGGNLGGLAGADARCQTLAAVAGAGGKTWRAYLSTQGRNAVDARDRIGRGPWYNANGAMIAGNVDELHDEDDNMIGVATGIDEHGAPVPYVGLDVDGNPFPVELQYGVEHDILTGSQADGTAYPAGDDMTCSNWTSDDEGSAMVGHGDRRTLSPEKSPWGMAHPSAGCSQQALINTGGAGRFYCFATD